MLQDLYNMRMLLVIVIVWAWVVIIIAAAVYSEVEFSQAEQPKTQMMYAAVFVCCVQFMTFVKIFAYQIIRCNTIKRQIRHPHVAVEEVDSRT